MIHPFNSQSKNSTEKITVSGQSIKMVIDGKVKLGYLTGETEEPVATHPVSHKKWKSENSLVMAWLVNSMEPSVGKTYLFLPMAKDIWETYSDIENFSQIFEIKTKLWKMKQGTRGVMEYFM